MKTVKITCDVCGADMTEEKGISAITREVVVSHRYKEYQYGPVSGGYFPVTEVIPDGRTG